MSSNLIETNFEIPICPMIHIPSQNVIVWSVNSSLYAYNIVQQRFILTEHIIYDSPILDLDYCESPSEFHNKLLIAYENKVILLYDIDRMEPTEIFLIRKKPVCAKFIQDGKALFIANRFGDLFIFDIDAIRAVTKECYKHMDNHLTTNFKDSAASNLYSKILQDLSQYVQNNSESDNTTAYATHLSTLSCAKLNNQRTVVYTGDCNGKIRVAPCSSRDYLEVYGYALNHSMFIQDVYEAPDVENCRSLFVSISEDQLLCTWTLDYATLYSEKHQCCKPISTLKLLHKPLKVFCVKDTLGVLHILVLQRGLSSILCIPVNDSNEMDLQNQFSLQLPRPPIALSIVETNTLQNLNTENYIGKFSNPVIYWVDEAGCLGSPITFTKNQPEEFFSISMVKPSNKIFNINIQMVFQSQNTKRQR